KKILSKLNARVAISVLLLKLIDYHKKYFRQICLKLKYLLILTKILIEMFKTENVFRTVNDFFRKKKTNGRIKIFDSISDKIIRNKYLWSLLMLLSCSTTMLGQMSPKFSFIYCLLITG